MPEAKNNKTKALAGGACEYQAMTQHGLRHILPLLAGSLTLLLAGAAVAAPGERPRLEDYPGYGEFVTAVVDYERAEEAAARKGSEKKDSADSELCQDSSDGGQTKKQNNCQGKYLAVDKPLADNATQPKEEISDFFLRSATGPVESLDDAIASAGYDSVSAANADALRNNSQGLTLQEISVDEMASAGVGGLLGLFNNIRMQNLGSSASPLGAWGLAAGGGSGASGDADGSVRLSLDDVILALDKLNVELFSTLVNFGDGYAIIDTTTSINASGGLHLGLSAEVYTALNIVDRDGMPGTEWDGAGAITMDRMVILIPYMDIDIQGVSADFERDNSLLTIDAYSPGEITVLLANSMIGAAAASVDGSYIGPSTPFLQFGPAGSIIIDPGTRINIALSQPDGLRTAFVTLNGRIGDISIRDIRLLDTVGGGDLRIGSFNIHNIDLVDTRIFVENKTVTVDVGRGLENVGFDIERVFLGSEGSGGHIGDFYARGARINELRFSATPH